MTKETIILDFMSAWNAHDLEKIMSFMTPDCLFLEARGTTVTGQKHKGFDKVKRAFHKVLSTFPDAQWKSPSCNVHEQKAYSEWTFVASISSSKKIEVNGIDVFTFKGDKIYCKDSFLKSRPAVTQ